MDKEKTSQEITEVEVSELEDGELEEVAGGINQPGCDGDCFCRLE